MDAVASMHHRVDDGLADHAQRQRRFVLAHEQAFGQENDCISSSRTALGAPDGRQQRARISSVSKRWLGSSTPLATRHADVVDAHHREAAPRRLRRAEQQQAGDGGLQLAALAHEGASERSSASSSQVSSSALALARWRGGGTCTAARVDVRQVGVVQYRAVEGLDCWPAYSATRSSRALPWSVDPTRRNAPRGRPSFAQVDRLLSRGGFGHEHDQHRLAAQRLHRQARTNRAVEHAGALAERLIGLQLVGVGHADPR